MRWRLVLPVLLLGAASCATSGNADTAARPTVASTTASGSDVPIAVQLDAPRIARTGAVLSMKARFRSPSGAAFVATVDWGDGTPTYHAPLTFSCPAGRPAPSRSATSSPAAPAASSSMQVLEHIYRVPGRRHVTVTAVHGGCPPGPVPTGGGRAVQTVTVTGPRLPGNGPVAPDGAIGLTSYGHGTLTGDVEGRDFDGYVSHLTIDWGDGSTPETFTNAAVCLNRPGVSGGSDP